MTSKVDRISYKIQRIRTKELPRSTTSSELREEQLSSNLSKSNTTGTDQQQSLFIACKSSETLKIEPGSRGHSEYREQTLAIPKARPANDWMKTLPPTTKFE
jgi:hypothetical protein